MVREGWLTATTVVYEQHRRHRTNSRYGRQTRVMHSGREGANLVLETSYVLTKGNLCTLEMEWGAMQHQERSASGLVVQDDRQR